MIAAGAGDAALARKKNREAVKLISSDQEPLIHLLDAQTSLLEGDHEAARRKFEAMVEDPETRLLGLRGLYLEAERLGERAAARHYAARAAGIAPQLGWAAESTLEERVERGDWDAALRLLDAQWTSRRIDRDRLNRRRAVLLTAKSMSLLDADPLAARNAGQEAARLAPDFVPAALAAARALFRQDDVRKEAKLLEAVWKKSPHPQVAELYIHARPGDSPLDRLARAKKLQSLKQNNPESLYAVARAALEAGEFGQARAAAEALLRQEPRERAFLLMADIEEADTGEQGRVREWLSRAVRAQRDAAWVADGYVSDRWAPFSPVTGRIDAFEWRVPVERAAQMIEPGRDVPARGALPPADASATAEPLDKILDIDIGPPVVAEEPAKPAVEDKPEPSAAEAPVVEAPPKPAAPRPASPRSRPAADRTAAEAVVFAGPPDDPGVDHDDESGEPNGRARLY
jgi:HemY protein